MQANREDPSVGVRLALPFEFTLDPAPRVRIDSERLVIKHGAMRRLLDFKTLTVTEEGN